MAIIIGAIDVHTLVTICHDHVHKNIIFPVKPLSTPKLIGLPSHPTSGCHFDKAKVFCNLRLCQMVTRSGVSMRPDSGATVICLIIVNWNPFGSS